MKILIVYKSYHPINTEKVARAMAEATNATLAKVDEVRPEDIATYDLVGFGSGIYGGRRHKELFTLAWEMPSMEKPAFVFSTSGSGKEAYHRPLKEALTAKGCHIRGEFQCRGEVRFLKFIRTNRDTRMKRIRKTPVLLRKDLSWHSPPPGRPDSSGGWTKVRKKTGSIRRDCQNRSYLRNNPPYLRYPPPDTCDLIP